VLGTLRFRLAPAWPRFATDALHRDVSLLVLVVLVVHIITSVLDSFAPISLRDAVIPFGARYRPLWLGLGALSFDLLVALVVTSVLRRSIGYRGWHAIHWLAYASWPVAVLHGLGTGSDTKQLWMLALTLACVAGVVAAALIRIGRSASASPGLRSATAAIALVTPLGLGVFALAGPLRSGWARRAGTPTSLLARAPRVLPAATRTPATAAHALRPPFSARLDGTATQQQTAGGAIIDLALRLSGGARGQLRIRLAGTPIDGGGLSLTGSQVDLAADGLPSVLAGRITGLSGQRFVADVSGAPGPALELQGDLSIDSGSGRVTGTLHARVRGGSG
jgi:sulfoxide reductase heme-binding subunit YedZ